VTSIFSSAVSPGSLYAAWERVRRNNGCAGGDAVTVAAFSRHADAHLRLLAESLKRGTYLPGPFRHIELSKDGGGTRRLSVPCVIDRVAQTAMATALAVLLEPEFEENSFGYRAGKSVDMAVRKIVSLRNEGFTHVVEGDVVCYFDSVAHDVLLELLAKHVPDTDAVALVALWLQHYGEDGRGLPQGSPISPLLANLYLDALDEAMHGERTRIVRFADDFVVLCKCKESAERAYADARELLAGRGLILHPEKTKLTRFEDGFVFLGHIFVRSLAMKSADEEPFPLPDAREPLAPYPYVEPGETPAAETFAPADSEETIDETFIRDRTLYMIDENCVLAAKNGEFAVQDRKTGKTRVRLRRDSVGRIEIGPKGGIETEALRLAAADDIGIYFTDGRGDCVASASSALCAERDNALLLAQAERALDPAKSLALARIFVAGKLRNSHAVLKRLNLRKKIPAVEDAAEDVKQAARAAKTAESLAALSGIEGAAAKRYWSGLSKLLAPDWGFSARKRRDALMDPANILFSWFGSLLTREIRTALIYARLHPGIGYLHSSRNMPEPLAYDFIEPFRAPVSDSLTVAAINGGIVPREAFVRGEDGRYRPQASVYRAVATQFETRMTGVVKAENGDRVSLRALIRRHARALARHIEGKGTYAAYKTDY
jgi:CRISPR-associated protein Cas1